MRTRTRGKARPNSSAVRRDPTAVARNRVPSQLGQVQVAAGAAHQRQALGRGARRNAERRFAKDVVVQQVEDLYRSLL